MRAVALGPIATGDAFTGSPDRPALVSERVLVYLQLCDLRATQLGRSGVRDDLSKAEPDHQPNVWRLVCGEHLVRDERAESP